MSLPPQLAAAARLAILSAALVATTDAVVWLGNAVGRRLIAGDSSEPPLESWARFDGIHYRQIAQASYSYDAGKRSDVAFFPLYPLLGRAVCQWTGCPTVWALLAVSHLSLWLLVMALAAYLRARSAPDGAPTDHPESEASAFALAAFLLWPPTFFFRMTYSEATVLLLIVLCMVALRRNLALPLVAVLAGLATAARHVSVALLLPLAWHVCTVPEAWTRRVGKLAWAGPLACWGLLAYMAFQYFVFGDALAFARTQQHWHIRPPAPPAEKLMYLLSWRPVWAVYDIDEPGYWWTMGRRQWYLNLQFANPIYFVGAGLLVGWGAWKRWLTAAEVLLSVGLLAIPYLTRAHEMCMNSHARFAAVVFPAYIVMGHLLAALPRVVSLALLGLMGAMLFLYSALFAAGYPFF